MTNIVGVVPVVFLPPFLVFDDIFEVDADVLESLLLQLNGLGSLLGGVEPVQELLQTEDQLHL